MRFIVFILSLFITANAIADLPLTLPAGARTQPSGERATAPGYSKTPVPTASSNMLPLEDISRNPTAATASPSTSTSTTPSTGSLSASATSTSTDPQSQIATMKDFQYSKLYKSGTNSDDYLGTPIPTATPEPDPYTEAVGLCPDVCSSDKNQQDCFQKCVAAAGRIAQGLPPEKPKDNTALIVALLSMQDGKNSDLSSILPLLLQDKNTNSTSNNISALLPLLNK
jgi:hypothetical protein